MTCLHMPAARFELATIRLGMPRPPRRLVVFLTLALVTTPGCFVRRRAVPTALTGQTRPLLTATKDELVQRVNGISEPIQDFSMKVDLSPSILNPAKGSATDYATVSAYVLFRKPADIRILGQDPVIATTIFDMVSTGNEFRVSIPRKKRFIIGSNDAPETSENTLENLRPAAILTALLIQPLDPASNLTVLEDDAERALYILIVVRRQQDQLTLARNVYFDRYTLQVTREKMFDATGRLVSDTKYSDWKTYDRATFPSQIDIQRPKENYEVQLSLVTMKMNSPDVTAEKFALKQPPDTQLQEVK